MITNKIVSAFPMPDFCIAVTFRNGIQGIFDMRPYLEEGVFRRLQDVRLFNAVRVDYGTLVWPEDIDIAPDTVEAELIVQKS